LTLHNNTQKTTLQERAVLAERLKEPNIVAIILLMFYNYMLSDGLIIFLSLREPNFTLKQGGLTREKEK